jgi:predicted dehydrogenase
MEAMWTRFLPVYDTVRRWIAEGRIGDLELIEASFGFAAPFDPKSRLFALPLAGGALLDVGVYPLTLARWLFGGEPEGIEVRAEIGDSGVDEHVTLRLDFPGGGVARLSCALNAALANAARLVGTEGHIDIPLFWRAQQATLTRGTAVEVARAPHLANGFEYQIAEVGRCLAAGKLQSSIMPWNESAAMTELCDRIRAIIGVRYPGDERR